MGTRYINTDLVLQSTHDLSAVGKYLEDHAELLYSGEFEDGLSHVSVEARGSGLRDDPEGTPERDIRILLGLLETMESRLQSQLAVCSLFELNIGWASSEQRPVGQFSLPPEILSRIAALGATLAVTIYPSSENDD